MSAEAKASSSGEGDAEFHADEVDQLDKPVESDSAAPLSTSAERPLLGARRDLAYGGNNDPKCSCLAVALGQPNESAFKWKDGAPRIDPVTQLVVALSSEGVSCSEDSGLGASYKGYTLSGGDVVVIVERAHPKRPIQPGAIIPRPTAGGQVYVVPDEPKLPFGKPLDGGGDRCPIGNPGAAQARAIQDVSEPQSDETALQDEAEDAPEEASEFVDEVDEYGIEKPANRPRKRDGFFLALHLAGDYLILNSTADTDTNPDTKTNGLGIGLDFLIGGTPSEGLALGAILGGRHYPTPSFEVDGVDGEAAFDLNFFHIGGFIDYYVSPNNGFHVLGEIAYAQFEADSDLNFQVNLKGVALGIGLGYDWWVSDSWSVGLLGRFTFSPMQREEYASSNQLSLPSLAFTATYH